MQTIQNIEVTPAASRFNAAREVPAPRDETRERRRRRFHRSRLDRYAHELIALRAAHATVSRWLRRQDA